MVSLAEALVLRLAVSPARQQLHATAIARLIVRLGLVTSGILPLLAARCRQLTIGRHRVVCSAGGAVWSVDAIDKEFQKRSSLTNLIYCACRTRMCLAEETSMHARIVNCNPGVLGDED